MEGSINTKYEKVLKLSSIFLCLFSALGILSVFFLNQYANTMFSISTGKPSGIFQNIIWFYSSLYKSAGFATFLLFIAGFNLSYGYLWKKFRNFPYKYSTPSFLIAIFLMPLFFEATYIIDGAIIGNAIKVYLTKAYSAPVDTILFYLLSTVGLVVSIVALDLNKHNVITFYKTVKKIINFILHKEPVKINKKTVSEGIKKAVKKVKKPSLKVKKPAEIKKTVKSKSSPTPASGIQDNVKQYKLPPLTLLDNPKEKITEIPHHILQRNADLLTTLLESFKVTGDVVGIKPGPVITLYEFKPTAGIKISKIVNLSDNIALSMSALSARIAVVPGRDVIGIELPNTQRKTVFFRPQLESKQFTQNDFALPLALGQNIAGNPVFVDLAKMPHLLIAGTTGSGKSVGVNSMILSLLYKYTPDECKFIMVDPKMLEFSVFKDIPHLLTPVVTDANKAVMALKWAVREMENRNKQMSYVGSKNIESFNKKARDNKGKTYVKRIEVGFDPETGKPIYEKKEYNLKPFPYLVVIIDEMADLMLVAGKEVEASIQRLAQMARAAGIHLILSTQRPSADVITGVIKSNFPTRISFKVTNAINSRVIIDMNGAEQLLGRGDMLHMSGGAHVTRVHGAFVSEKEVENIADFWRRQAKPEYVDGVFDEDVADSSKSILDKTLFSNSKDSKDAELYKQAVGIVLDTKKTSISFVQRSLRIGYNRAADLIDKMEADGILSSPDSTGKRKLLD